MEQSVKSKNQCIQYDGKVVSFRRMHDGQRFIAVRKRIKVKDFCPLCKKRFLPENTTSVSLVISNQAGVPNRFVHDECLEDKTLEYAFRLIAEDWKEAQRYQDWF